MKSKRKITVNVEIIKEDEVSEEVVKAFIRAIENKEKFYTVEELKELLQKNQRDL